MGRKRLEHGRRVMIGARVSESVAAEIDRLRGSRSRSAWLESAIRAHLGDSVPAKLADGFMTGPPPLAPDALDGLSTPAFSGAKPELRRIERCKHPGTRVIGGFCKQCDHLIAPGGYFT